MAPSYTAAEGTLKASVTLNGKNVDVTLSSSNNGACVVQWRGVEDAGRLSLKEDVVGFRQGASTITLYVFESSPAGCFSAGAKKRKDLLIEFHEDERHSEWADALQKWFDNSGRPKRLLVLVNPVGGSGKATKIYREDVGPLLAAAGIVTTKMDTQFYRHAIEIAKEVDLSAHDGIVCVSGDGILVEVLNGLLQRHDWRDAIKMPLGVVPAGSGNGMAMSLLNAAGQECNPINATLAIITGNVKKVDVATVAQQIAADALSPATSFHSVLNITWGFVSDVDIESEKYRWMGGLRLTVQSVVRILSMRRYRGRFSYLPASPESAASAPSLASSESSSGGYSGKTLSSVQAQQQQGWRDMDGDFVLVWLQNVPWAATDLKSHPRAQVCKPGSRGEASVVRFLHNAFPSRFSGP
eukprot:TRINITY_DN6663_c0_g1_i1.p1 TRINITY_DN6663_c0_g1~~TRINITY_DN6663_c0_g1_i1.p1  ORF type:complete len:411 (+),score=73.68 TRINITY_DN6663_c0_g1_i1:281-1513(+)